MKTHPAAASSDHSSAKASLKSVSHPKYSIQFTPSIPDNLSESMAIVLGITKATYDERDEHVHSLACYFASSVSKEAKLKRLKLLISLVTTEESCWQLLDSILRDTLRFLTDRSFDWPHEQHTAHVVLIELRAMCLYEMERQSKLVKSSQVAAGCIFGAARLVESGLTGSIPIIHVVLDLAGLQAKQCLTPASAPLSSSQKTRTMTREVIVTKTYTDMAKRTTSSVCETAQWTANTIRDASTERIRSLAQKCEERRLGEVLIPNEGYRNALVAAGTVGIASLGAAAIVGEAIVTTTASVACKSAAVTADVVRYKYGDHAGQVVEDASHTTGNVLKTVASVTMLETTVFAKSVAKNTVKVQARRTHEGEEEYSTTMDRGEDSLTALKEGKFESYLIKVDPHNAAIIMNKKEMAKQMIEPMEKKPSKEASVMKKERGGDLI